MNPCRIKLISLCVLALGALAVIWSLATASAPISMRVLSLTAKQLPHNLAQPMDNRGYVVATIELTNASKRPVVYWARYDAKFAEYSVLHRAATGWKETGGGGCGTGLKQFTLAPSQTVIFEASIEREKPCRVALNYSNGRTPSRLWQRLPGWLAQRLPWGGDWTVTTDVIDLRGAALAVKRVEPLTKPPEPTQVVQAAAQRGDIDAQFRLAGRYLTGTGVEKSLTEALRWYHVAATNGHIEAAYNIGTIYEFGLGTASDETKAIEWYRRASDRGHGRAQEKVRTLATK